MHKHRLAQAGLFSHLPPSTLGKDTSGIAQRYRTNMASCLQFMWEFHPRYILNPSGMPLQRGKYIIARKAFR